MKQETTTNETQKKRPHRMMSGPSPATTISTENVMAVQSKLEQHYEPVTGSEVYYRIKCSLTDEAAGEAAAAAGVFGRVLLGHGAPELRLDAVLEVRVGADDPENLQGKT